ncbi:MAG: type 2 isopentenyl-diphosphate Delta-isomerase [Oligoflexales bacterium]
MSHSDRVQLVPFLPWTAGATTGFIEEIGKDRLFLRFVSPLPEQNFRLVAACSSNVTFEFAGTLGSKIADGLQSFVIDSTSLPALQDLLTYVRKQQHIAICRDQDVEASDKFTGFSDYSFVPEALPELNWSDIDTSTRFLGRRFDLPLLITGMTGGIEQGEELNKRLARCAVAFGIPMGVGSQRIGLENPKHAKIFQLKLHSPDLFLIGNIGLSQILRTDAADLCQKAVDMIEADALAVHVNVLQEIVQVEGDRSFRGALLSIEEICRRLPVPVIVKEVGSGIGPDTAAKLFECGVSAVDVGGRGGTSWGYIEGKRSVSESTKLLADQFRDWGIPTAYALRASAQRFPDREFVATGGVRDGLTVAKAVALGARTVGIGLPLLRAALRSEEELAEVMDRLKKGLQIAMIATGCSRLEQLKTRLCLGKPFEKVL